MKDREKKEAKLTIIFLFFKWLSGRVWKYIKWNTMWFEQQS